MSEEKILMREGEDLARIAVESGMGSRQLLNLYRMAYKMFKRGELARQLAYIEACIMRQMGRDVKGFMAFARIRELLKKYENNSYSFVRVLMYAAMLYDYCEKEPTMKHRMVAEPIIRRIVEDRDMSLESISLRLRGRNLDIHVKVQGLFMSPKALSDEIVNALKRKEEFSNLSLRVRVESR